MTICKRVTVYFFHSWCQKREKKSRPLPQQVVIFRSLLEIYITTSYQYILFIYFQEVEKIIEQDFFPDLTKLRAQTEYMQALEKNDLAKLKELELKFFTRPNTEKSICKFWTYDGSNILNNIHLYHCFWW